MLYYYLIMRYFVGFLSLTFMLSSCFNSSKLEKEFNCKSSKHLSTETVEDIFESYSVLIPKKWKSSLYYDNLQSEIFTADTTRVLEDTFLMEFSMINGKMSVNETFKNKVIEKAKANGLVMIKDNFIDYNEHKGYYHYGKGIQNNLAIHVFQYYIKIDDEKYFMTKTEIYGNDKVKERLCASFNLINSITFNQKN